MMKGYKYFCYECHKPFKPKEKSVNIFYCQECMEKPESISAFCVDGRAFSFLMGEVKKDGI